MGTPSSKTCIVLAPGGTDLSELRAALLDHGYRLVAPSAAIPGRSWLAILQESLHAVDLVVGVLPDTTPAVLNTVFELGVAVTLGRPVLVLADPHFDELPLTLAGLPVVRAPARSREAVSFALEALADLRPSAEVAQPVRPRPSSHRGDVTNVARRLQSASTEAEVIETLAALFLAAGADVVSEASVGHRKVDLAVWSDAMGAYVGNPLIVEVKTNLKSNGDVDRALATLTTYVHASGAPWGLLLYKDFPQREYLNSQSGKAARVLVVSFDELISGLSAQPLFEFLRGLRNRKVHGVEYPVHEARSGRRG